MNTLAPVSVLSPRKLRRRLQLALILSLLAVLGVAMTLVAVKLAAIRQDVFSVLITTTTERAASGVRDFFAPISSNLNLFRRWGETTDMEALTVDRTAKQFIPVLEEFPQLSAAMIADSTGLGYFVYRDHSDWLTRTVGRTGQEGQAIWQRWKDMSGPVDQWTRQSDYDPRTRPWYRGATDPDRAAEVYWTSPYTFATAQQAGVTAAVSWRGKAGDTHVVAFDVLLEQIRRHMARLQVGANGRAYLLNADGVPLTEAVSTETTPVASAVQHALQSWRDEPEARHDVRSVRSGGQTYWAGFRPVFAGDPPVWIGVVVPEGDLEAEIRSRQSWVWITAGLVLLLAVLVATFIARYFGRQLEAAGRGAAPSCDSEAELKALIAQGESDRLEFKSTLRWNLKAERMGKEIELAWLKGAVAFLNTDGGTVLIGVADDGGIVGLDYDDFANDDRCLLHFNNLVNQHVGQEFARYLSPRICPVEGKRVLLVHCHPSPEPAFLKTRQEEDFYVRTGPRNAKMPVSKALKYIHSRQARG